MSSISKDKKIKVSFVIPQTGWLVPSANKARVWDEHKTATNVFDIYLTKSQCLVENYTLSDKLAEVVNQHYKLPTNAITMSANYLNTPITEELHNGIFVAELNPTYKTAMELLNLLENFTQPIDHHHILSSSDSYACSERAIVSPVME